jgi:hypothetical protein
MVTEIHMHKRALLIFIGKSVARECTSYVIALKALRYW